MRHFEPRRIEQTPELKQRLESFEEGEHTFYRRIATVGAGVLAVGAVLGSPNMMLAGGFGLGLGVWRTNSKVT